jgi:hypothetical protein
MTEYVEISGDFSQRTAADPSPSRRLQAVTGDLTFRWRRSWIALPLLRLRRRPQLSMRRPTIQWLIF